MMRYKLFGGSRLRVSELCLDDFIDGARGSGFVVGNAVGQIDTTPAARSAASSAQWPPELDALRAAPASHRLLLENDRVRVLEIAIEPGAREPEHTHRWPSVMIVDRAARIRYYENGVMTFESPPQSSSEQGPNVTWMDPEGPHAVENIDQQPYHGLRIEVKG